MQTPLQITFRDMEPSPAVESKIRDKAAKLEQFYDHITSCRVTVQAPHAHSQQGKLFEVRIELEVPGRALVVSHEHHHRDQAHEDAYVAVRDAFDAMQRQLEDYARKRRGEVKRHDTPV